jgi:hypothetical protein
MFHVLRLAGCVLTYNALAVTRELLLPVALAILLLLELLLLLLLDLVGAALAVCFSVSPLPHDFQSLHLVQEGVGLMAENAVRTYGERTLCRKSELLTARTQRAG